GFGREISAVKKRDAPFNAVPRRIAPRDRQGWKRYIRGDQHRPRKLRRQCDHNAAAARADIHDDDLRVARKQRQGSLDDRFRFWPRREHVARDLELKAPELPVSDDLGHGLSLEPACNQGIVFCFEICGWWLTARYQ